MTTDDDHLFVQSDYCNWCGIHRDDHPHPTAAAPAPSDAGKLATYLMGVSVEELYGYAAAEVGQRLGEAAELLERQAAEIAALRECLRAAAAPAPSDAECDAAIREGWARRASK